MQHFHNFKGIKQLLASDENENIPTLRSFNIVSCLANLFKYTPDTH